MKPLLITDMFALFNADKIPNMRYANRLNLGISGAILMDLVVQEKIELKGSKVILVDTSTTEDSFLDEAIAILSLLGKNKKIKYYLNNFLRTGAKLFPILMDRLENLDLMKITMSERRIMRRSFMYFTVTNFNNDIRETVINDLKNVLIENRPVPNKIVWYLISLLRATNGYIDFFGKDYKSQVKSKIKEIIIDEPIGKAVRSKIRSAESSDSGSFD